MRQEGGHNWPAGGVALVPLPLQRVEEEQVVVVVVVVVVGEGEQGMCDPWRS